MIGEGDKTSFFKMLARYDKATRRISLKFYAGTNTNLQYEYRSFGTPWYLGLSSQIAERVRQIRFHAVTLK